MTDGYGVLVGELEAHAGKVDALAGRLQAAVDAARQVTMSDEAYGVLCRPFAMLLQPFEQSGVDALAKGVETITGVAAGVRATAGDYRAREQAEAAAFDGIEVG
ncbi:type VII secretion target [Actinosynnema sp. CS-041913]|uniref:type VII secretion target n=1 Tax=Actinosynnema sp. CS-041913 TaxID=3239917 RepID=UPI003D92C3B7